MPKYKFTCELEYDFEADDEADAIYVLADIIRRDWMGYIDEGELKLITEEI